MYIKKVVIKNFRGLDIDIDNLKEDFLIIGKNGSGKSNLCHALRKVLDYDIRKSPLTESDSSNFNKKDIKIQIVFNLSDISVANRTRLGKNIDKYDDIESLTVTLDAKFSETTQYYDESISFGTLDKSKNYSTNQSNPLDKVVSLIYISPNYNFEKDKNNFFKYQQIKSIENQTDISNQFQESVENLNNAIYNDVSIQKIKDDINMQEGFESIFEDIKFSLTSNINISNMYKSLNIIPLSSNNEKAFINIGDGKNKTLSMLLQKLSYDEEKHKIFIVEEPENHLYPLLQKYYATLTSKMGMDQVIYTSHSPFIIDLRKMKQIIKLVTNINEKKEKSTKYYSLNTTTDDYKAFGFLLNEEIAEMFFYDQVLLIEGLSEKYFYNVLAIRDEKFQKFLAINKMGIFNVMGVDFSPAKMLLEKLGIKVMIKTDNDIFKVPRKNVKRYAGFDRTLNCLSPESTSKLKDLFDGKNVDKDLFRFDAEKEFCEIIENKLDKLQEIYAEDGVYISICHDGFEGDFLEFIDKSKIELSDLDFLKKAKLKNLHLYVQENQIEFIINEINKDSILVRFIQ